MFCSQLKIAVKLDMTLLRFVLSFTFSLSTISFLTRARMSETRALGGTYKETMPVWRPCLDRNASMVAASSFCFFMFFALLKK